MGKAADAILEFQEAIRVNPRSPNMFGRYRLMGEALLFVGRYDDAVQWLGRSLAANPGDSARNLSNI